MNAFTLGLPAAEGSPNLSMHSSTLDALLNRWIAPGVSAPGVSALPHRNWGSEVNLFISLEPKRKYTEHFSPPRSRPRLLGSRGVADKQIEGGSVALRQGRESGWVRAPPVSFTKLRHRLRHEFH